MTEIVLPDPEPVAETEPAHTCEGWVAIERGSRPTCQRCVDRLAHYRSVAAGNGTVEEIREAIGALDVIARQGTPMGVCVRTKIKGLTVWACPRSVNVSGDDGDPVPLIAVATNRDARRGGKKKRRRFR